MKKFKVVNLIFLLSLTLMSILGVYVGIQTKKSFKHVSFNEIMLQKNDFIMDKEMFPIKEIPNIKDLYNNSDTILKVTPINNSQIIVSENTLTKCKVIKNIKGEEQLDEIYVYEDMYIHTLWDGYPKPPTKMVYDINSFNGYNFMKQNNEYILFLNESENPFTTNDIPTFKLSYSTYSKYPASDDYTYKIIDINKRYKYLDLYTYDIYFSNKTENNTYKNLFKSIVKSY